MSPADEVPPAANVGGGAKAGASNAMRIAPIVTARSGPVRSLGGDREYGGGENNGDCGDDGVRRDRIDHDRLPSVDR